MPDFWESVIKHGILEALCCTPGACLNRGKLSSNPKRIVPVGFGKSAGNGQERTARNPRISYPSPGCESCEAAFYMTRLIFPPRVFYSILFHATHSEF